MHKEEYVVRNRFIQLNGAARKKKYRNIQIWRMPKIQ